MFVFKTKFTLLKIVVTLIILLFALSLIFFLYAKKYDYSYNTHLSYNYNFDSSNAEKFELNFVNDSFILPEDIDINDKSIFIKINVASTFIGNFFQPYFKIKSGQKKSTHYLEYGAEGIRYLNVSNITNSDAREIILKGNHIKTKDQKIELYAFENLDLATSKILIISPHPDDAEIAAYGLYAKNKNSYIVTITAGDAGPYNYDEVYKDSTSHYLQKGKLRTWNSITVPLLGGIPYQNIVNLGFFNGTLEEMKNKDSLPVKSLFSNTSDIQTFRKQNISNLKDGFTGKSNWKSLVNNLCYLLDTLKPEIIVSPYPPIDTHSDHKYSTIAIIEALRKSNIKKGYFLLYTNHHPLSGSYPYGETGDAITLPPNFDNNFYFKSIYSNHLPESLQKDKFFALEAMNDLRLDTEWRDPKGAIIIALKTIKRKYLGPDIDYFRRAVRENELFFVIPYIDIYDNEKLNHITGNIKLNN